jgi:hypothetical protein
VAALLAAGLLAGCGGGSSSPSSTTPKFDDAGAQAEVKANWEKFFDPKEPLESHVALLENGEALRAAVVSQAKNPLAAQAESTVTKVVVDPATHAKATVTYDISLNGSKVVTGGEGAAVLQDGKWKVAKDTFCGLANAGASAGQKIPGCS